MMATLSMKQFRCFNSSIRVDRLNHFIRDRHSIMPHEIASATGCDLKASMGLLLYLLSLSLVEARILIYHVEHQSDPPIPVTSRAIADGLPSLPFECGECGEIVDTYDDLRFDYSFILNEDLVFNLQDE